jgi:Na+/proline symporter
MPEFFGKRYGSPALKIAASVIHLHFPHPLHCQPL